MSKRLAMLSVLALVIASLATKASFTAVPQKKASEAEAPAVKEHRDPWRLRSRDKEGAREEVASWANGHFNSTGGKVFGDVKDIITPTLPMKLVKRVEFDVLPIPEWRRVAGYEEAKVPTYHAVYVLRDAGGDLYNVTVESYDPNREDFVVHSVGPALERSPEASSRPVNERRLQSWPAENITTRNPGVKGKPVLIPYPYSMNQVFFQYGDDPSTSTFVSLNTGETYLGLHSILNAVDTAWQSTR